MGSKRNGPKTSSCPFAISVPVVTENLPFEAVRYRNPYSFPLPAYSSKPYALYQHDGEILEELMKGNSMKQSQPTLPSNRAFVVQFRSSVADTTLQDIGRVEHVVSGQATHFDSWQDLQRFIEQTLGSVSEKPP